DDLVDRIRLLLRHGILRRLGLRSLASARADVTSICGSNLSPDAGFRRGGRRNWQQRAALIRRRHWKPRKEESCPRSRQRTHHAVVHSRCREENGCRAAASDVAEGSVGSGQNARPDSRSGASLLRAALEQGTAAGAEVATVMGHARPDTIDVRDVLLAEPHRIRFASRALLRGPLLRRGGRRRERERKAHERGDGHARPELHLCDTNFHYRPSSWCSAPVSTVNPTSMASSAGMLRGALTTPRPSRGAKLNTDG